MAEQDPIRQLLARAEPPATPTPAAKARMLEAIVAEAAAPPKGPSPVRLLPVLVVGVALTALLWGWLGMRASPAGGGGTPAADQAAEPTAHPGAAPPGERPASKGEGPRIRPPSASARPAGTVAGGANARGTAGLGDPSARSGGGPGPTGQAAPGPHLGGGVGPVGRTVAGAGERTFAYAESTRIGILNPLFAEDMASVRAVELIFDPLVFVDARGELTGGLATAWTEHPDRRSIRFELREGVTWHDGRPFTAADVVFTIEAALDPKTRPVAPDRFAFIESARALGTHAVEVRFKRPVRQAARRFRFMILPQHPFRSTRVKRAHRFSRQPIGTGPYRVRRHTPRAAVLDAYPARWRPAKLASIRAAHIPDLRAQLDLLRFAGQRVGVQAVVFVPPRFVPLLENNDTVTLEPYHTVAWWYLAFNHRDAALAQQPVREAIALALDREALRAAHLGQGEVLSGPFVESSPFHDFAVTPRSQDLQRARQILDDAGFAARAGRARRRGRIRLQFKLVVDKDLPAGQALALGIQAQLAAIGVEVQPVFLDHARYRERVLKKRQFDLTLNTWSFERHADVDPLFHSAGAQNFIRFADPETDTLLDAARRTTDYKQYAGYQKRLHARLHETLPYVFLWSLDVYSGISRELKDVRIQPYYYFTTIEDWGWAR